MPRHFDRSALLRFAFAMTIASTGLAAAIAQPPEALESISPTNEAVNVGYAGEYPADIARFLLARGAGGMAISPDGKNLALRLATTGKPQLWMMPVVGGQPQQLTFGNGITFFRWHPDSQSLIYGADNDGNEQESYIQISRDGARERVVLPAIDGGFRSFGDFSGNGTTFAYASTERNGLDFDIYTADLASGRSQRLFEGKYGFFVRAVSQDGDRIVLSETVGEDSDNLYLYERSKADLRVLSVPEPRANHSDGNVLWSPDGGSLIFATNKDREFTNIVRYDLTNDEMITLYQSDGDAEGLTLCGKAQDILVFTVNRDGFSQLQAMDIKRGRAIKMPLLPDGVYQVDCAKTDDNVAVRVNAWNRPGDIFAWSLAKPQVIQIYASEMAGLDRDQLVKPIPVRMKARDGVELQGLLYLPARKEGAPKPPVVFDVHGGPTGQSRPSFDGPTQYLVGRGIAVFQPNVRGSTGFGRTYTTLDDRAKRLDSVRDLVDMLDHLRKDGRVDVDRAAVSGGSYGGYMVNAVLAEYPDAFQAGVSLFGVADWVTALEVASPALKASDRIEYGDITQPEWRKFYTENSPIRQADKIRVPVLYSHGVMDPRISIAETETMVRALRANGIEAPFIRIPDEGHGWRKLSNRLFYFRREAAFLEEKLGLTAPQ